MYGPFDGTEERLRAHLPIIVGFFGIFVLILFIFGIYSGVHFCAVAAAGAWRTHTHTDTRRVENEFKFKLRVFVDSIFSFLLFR